MSSVLISSLEEIAFNLKTYQEIHTLKCINKEFQAKIASHEFCQLFHHHKYNTETPIPEIVHVLEEHKLVEYPWCLGFSFISQKFFFQHEGKTYYNFLPAYHDALIRKEKWEAGFIHSHFGLNIAHVDKKTLILTPRKKQRLTRQQIEYIAEQYTEMVYFDKDTYFVDHLANHGDIEYFEEMLETKILQGFNYDQRERYELFFVKEMIRSGQERLLEAYEKYKPELTYAYIDIYHPDQDKIEAVDKDRLYILSANTYEETFKRLKELYDKKCKVVVWDFIEDNHQFTQWVIKEHPEVVKKWYKNTRCNYSVYKYLGAKDIDVGYYIVYFLESAYATGDTWDTISSILKINDTFMRDVVRYNIYESDYKRLQELIAWNRESTINALEGLMCDFIKYRDKKSPEYQTCKLFLRLFAE